MSQETQMVFIMQDCWLTSVYMRMILHEQIELNEVWLNEYVQVSLVDGFTVTLVRYAFNGI
jgi:hypothetical protein